MLAAETRAADLAAPAVSPAPDFDDLWKQIAEPVGEFLEHVSDQLLKQVGEFDPEIAPYARYVLGNQGKQLRPALVGLCANAAGQLTPPHVKVAVIVEMVHLATLVHDDVMDEAEIRRRRPTAAISWGNEISVLLGDCLFANALKLAASFPTPDICRAVSTATNTVCSGEILQTLRRGNQELSRAEYQRILEKKTGELFALSCELGAQLAGASEARKGALRRFGLLFGTAYQMFDDCLDLFGAEASVGKSLGTDLATGKWTLPVLCFWERSDAHDRARFQNWLDGWEPRLLPRVVELLQKYDALTAAQAQVNELLGTARRCLERLPLTDSRLSLVTLTDLLAQQTQLLGVLCAQPSQP